MACSSRRFRLLNACGEPHEQLDALYDSFEEAVADAIDWLHGDRSDVAIGVEVTAANGDWRMLRTPMPWLCRLGGPQP
jgi:hypothetical protein